MSTTERKNVPGTDIIDDPADYTEAAATALVLANMPPIKTVGRDWYVYEGGLWAPTSLHRYRPTALGVLGGKLQTARRAGEILRHIESLKQVDEAELRGFYTTDGDVVLINVANGVLRIESGEVARHLHKPEYNFTRQLAARHDPDAKCPLFLSVLTEALPDKEDRRMLRLFAGSLLLPSCRFETALVCYGPGGTGKSTIADAVARVLGESLVERIGMANICDPGSYHLPKLRHVAVNLGTELDALEMGESGHYKALVSGEPVSVRSIYGSPFTMQTACKLWFLANTLPRFKHGTDAELRRTRFLRFDHVPAEKDVELKAKLASERDGVFNWCLRGLTELMALRQMPLGGSSSRQVHARFAISNDPLGAFIAARCVIDPGARIEKMDFKNALMDWCEQHAIPCADDGWLFRQLWERWPQLRDAKVREGTGRIRVIAGVRLR